MDLDYTEAKRILGGY